LMLKEWGKTRTDLLTIQESPELPPTQADVVASAGPAIIA
jgi:hypothetical protein